MWHQNTDIPQASDDQGNALIAMRVDDEADDELFLASQIYVWSESRRAWIGENDDDIIAVERKFWWQWEQDALRSLARQIRVTETHANRTPSILSLM